MIPIIVSSHLIDLSWTLVEIISKCSSRGLEGQPQGQFGPQKLAEYRIQLGIDFSQILSPLVKI